MRSGATCRAGAALAVALTILPVMATADAPAGDTTYDDGPTLGERLLRNVVRVQALDLPEHGFGIVQSGAYDEMTERVLAAFQMKNRPARYDGVPDAQTAAILDVLTTAP